MVLPLVLAVAGALLAIVRFVTVVRLDLVTVELNAQLRKLLDAGNVDRARKLSSAAAGTLYGEMCLAALTAFLADPQAEPLAATAAAERAFVEEQRRQAARLGGPGRAAGFLAVLLGLAALGLVLALADAMGELLVPALIVGGFAVVAAGGSERRAFRMIRVSGEQFPLLLDSLRSFAQRAARERVEAADAAERARKALAVAAAERARGEVRAEAARKEELRVPAEELVASSRAVCRFCSRPYLAQELACPACGGPSAR